MLVVLVIGLPMFWMLSSSLKTLQEIYTFPPKWIPTSPRWENYQEAWNAVPFGRFYINSIIITVAGASLQIINGTLCAYAFAFLKFPGQELALSPRPGRPDGAGRGCDPAELPLLREHGPRLVRP